MLSGTILQRIQRTLWPEDLPGYTKVFTIADGAQDKRLYGAADASRQDRCCLYSVERRWGGQDLPWQLLMTAPYLVELDPEEEFTRYVLRNGWDHHWGIFFRADSGIQKVRRHFRDLLTVRDDKGRKLMFRYYDPRVLRAYLPTCLPSELRQVFGPVEVFIVPGDDPETALVFRLNDGRLSKDVVVLREGPAAAVAAGRSQ
ncbi:MAG: DUF4123 domain-containing protein [Bryobacteraceae bacterium]|jgi:hypothetical protein